MEIQNLKEESVEIERINGLNASAVQYILEEKIERAVDTLKKCEEILEVINE